MWRVEIVEVYVYQGISGLIRKKEWNNIKGVWINLRFTHITNTN